MSEPKTPELIPPQLRPLEPWQQPGAQNAIAPGGTPENPHAIPEERIAPQPEI